MARARGNRFSKKKIERAGLDFSLIVILIFLLSFGLIMIYSASSYDSTLKHGTPSYFFYHQLISTAVAIVVLVAVVFAKYSWLRYFAYVIYGASLILVSLVRTPLGIEVNGAKRWIDVMGVSLQPAEACKIAAIVLTAYLIVSKKRTEIESFKGTLIILGPTAAMSAFVLVFTNNLSSALIIFAIALIMYIVTVKNYKSLFIWGFIGTLSLGLIVLVKLFLSGGNGGFRMARILAWRNPEAYASGTGFQTLQALYSIGSGGFFGKGLGQSMQKLGSLPEAQNDMIFSIICEELGMFGAFAIMLMFVALIWRCVIIAQNANDMFGALLVVGVMAHIAVQVILNIAVVTNVIPNTGVTLPFISYGGTSIVFTLVEMGIVLNVSKSIIYE